MGTLAVSLCFSKEVLWLFLGPARDKVTLREEDAGHPLSEPRVSMLGVTQRGQELKSPGNFE